MTPDPKGFMAAWPSSNRNSELRFIGELTIGQRTLLHIMARLQFGRVEHLLVREGQPVFQPNTSVIRSVRLSFEGVQPAAPLGHTVELKRPVRDLFAELDRIQDGTILRLEFRHGLPCLIEVVEKEVESPG